MEVHCQKLAGTIGVRIQGDLFCHNYYISVLANTGFWKVETGYAGIADQGDHVMKPCGLPTVDANTWQSILKWGKWKTLVSNKSQSSVSQKRKWKPKKMIWLLRSGEAALWQSQGVNAAWPLRWHSHSETIHPVNPVFLDGPASYTHPMSVTSSVVRSP